MIGTLIRTSSSSVASIVPHVFHRFSAGATLVAQETTSYVVAAGFTGWIGDLFIWLMTKLMGFVGVLMSGGVYTFLVFDSPYTDPQYLQAFDHLLGIFPQLLAVVVMAGFASQPFSKKADVDSVILVWKALKAIIFVAVGRQLMHFGLLLVNAVVTYIYPQSYGAFSTEILKSGMEGAAASAGVVAVGMVILSVTSIIGILLLFAMLIVREFLFVAMFVTLPILAVMLYLDFGPFEDSAKAAKMFINATLSLFLAGIFMAALMFVGTVAVGGGGHGAANAAANAGSNPGSFNDVLESFLFWLIGLVAPALYGLKTAMSSGFIPGRVRSRRKRSSGSRSAASSGRSGESSRASIMKQARFGGKQAGSYASSKIGSLDQRTTGGKVGEKLNSSVNKATSTSSGIKDSFGSKVEGTIAEDATKAGKRGTQYTKKGGKRAAKDARSGTNFALRNLDRSPLDWAEAGLEHYRENPVINDPQDGVGSKQQTLREWADSSTSDYRSK
ncbi:hypothetical protein [Haladaptatus halobius]|uniref:hypothetical protein n=1 Tax=Haladaptatus halobius TaxID=2884875 RepID=UPI001D0BCBE0|nr:hypothetical protein [Haladaptatus halobius]